MTGRAAPTGTGGLKQPNSRNCFACGLANEHGLGLRFYNRGAGVVETEYTAPPKHEGYPGVVHGGIVAALLDEVVGRTVMVEDPNHFMLTGRLEIRYRRPIPIEVPLRITGTLTKQRGRSAKARAELRLPGGELGAEAVATLVDHPLAGEDDSVLQALGWRIYPD